MYIVIQYVCTYMYMYKYVIINLYYSSSPVSVHKDSLLYKLRWVTLGYHYDWTSKLYHKENHSPFPSDLSLLSHFILSSVGFPDFKAEAAIVNYYHFESTLSGHTDNSEADLMSPLISLRYVYCIKFVLLLSCFAKFTYCHSMDLFCLA